MTRLDLVDELRVLRYNHSALYVILAIALYFLALATGMPFFKWLEVLPAWGLATDVHWYLVGQHRLRRTAWFHDSAQGCHPEPAPAPDPGIPGSPYAPPRH